MKYIVLVCDGMSDRAVDSLGGKTPLELSSHPFMDYVVKHGVCGQVQTLFDGFPMDSGVANLSLLGYDVSKHYPGRAPLEAGNMDVELGETDVAFRCNLITEKDGKIFDFTSGHISIDDAKKIILDLDEFIKSKGFTDVDLIPGVSYRHLLVLRDVYSDEVECMPPHDIVGENIKDNLVGGKDEKTRGLLNQLMQVTKEFLENHTINKGRVSGNLNPGNMIWIWGGGKKPDLQKFSDKYGLSGSLISAVDLLKGIAKHVGLDVIEVEGATGYLDTNYEGKARAAIEALKENDFVYIHVESTDEAGHEGSIKHKIQAIEDIDSRLLRILIEDLEEPYALLVTSDHATPIEVKTHVSDLVPYAFYKTGVQADEASVYTENEIREKGSLGVNSGSELIKNMVEKK